MSLEVKGGDHPSLLTAWVGPRLCEMKKYRGGPHAHARFVSVWNFSLIVCIFYYPKSNNQEKKIMTTRMQTSTDKLNRAYLKYYNTPDTLSKVKIEPLQDLINKASSGQANAPVIINNAIVEQEPKD